MHVTFRRAGHQSLLLRRPLRIAIGEYIFCENVTEELCVGIVCALDRVNNPTNGAETVS